MFSDLNGCRNAYVRSLLVSNVSHRDQRFFSGGIHLSYILLRQTNIRLIETYSNSYLRKVMLVLIFCDLCHVSIILATDILLRAITFPR